MLKNKYVLFICGGKWQMPWLKYLQHKGHKIILVDPYTFSTCIKLADIHIACDARDTEFIYSEIINNNYEVEFVTSDQTDVSVNTVAILSKKLGLVGNDPEIVNIFANKLENRLFLKNNFKSHFPNFIKAFSVQDIISFYEDNGRDIIIKPVDAQSSRGIFKIDSSNFSSLESFYRESVSFSKLDYIIAEKFIYGKEITVEGLCVNNKHYTLATSSKKHFRTGIASELKYPSTVNSDLLKKLYAFHNEFIEKTELKFGITHSEYIINNEETDFWLVESACRGGGSLIPSDIVPWVANLSLYDIMYTIISGQPVSVEEPEIHRHAILYFFEFKNGTVKRMEGIEEAKQIDGVLDVDFEFKEGSRIVAASDDRGRQGYTIILAPTEEELNAKLESVIDTIKITIE